MFCSAAIDQSGERGDPLNSNDSSRSAWGLASDVEHGGLEGSIDQSANDTQSPVRPVGEFFAAPTGATQRRYEALRAPVRLTRVELAARKSALTFGVEATALS